LFTSQLVFYGDLICSNHLSITCFRDLTNTQLNLNEFLCVKKLSISYISRHHQSKCVLCLNVIGGVCRIFCIPWVLRLFLALLLTGCLIINPANYVLKMAVLGTLYWVSSGILSNLDQPPSLLRYHILNLLQPFFLGKSLFWNFVCSGLVRNLL
jgi:hypothetical protein